MPTVLHGAAGGLGSGVSAALVRLRAIIEAFDVELLEMFLAVFMFTRGVVFLAVVREEDLTPAVIRAMLGVPAWAWGAVYASVGFSSLVALSIGERGARVIATSFMVAVVALVVLSAGRASMRAPVFVNSVVQLIGSMFVLYRVQAMETPRG